MPLSELPCTVEEARKYAQVRKEERKEAKMEREFWKFNEGVLKALDDGEDGYDAEVKPRVARRLRNYYRLMGYSVDYDEERNTQNDKIQFIVYWSKENPYE
jgi:hypothetical protein